MKFLKVFIIIMSLNQVAFSDCQEHYDCYISWKDKAKIAQKGSLLAGGAASFVNAGAFFGMSIIGAITTASMDKASLSCWDDYEECLKDLEEESERISQENSRRQRQQEEENRRQEEERRRKSKENAGNLDI